MKNVSLRPLGCVTAVTAACLLSGWGSRTTARVQPPVRGPVRKEAAVTAHARGSFEVKLSPQGPQDGTGGSRLGRTSIDKQFHGDLEATSKGEMLTAVTEVEGSAGYVAIERVSGALHGRRGSFVLQHSGTMTRGVPRLAITVVPDSGTGELAGLAGTMAITIANGRHSYDLEYTLASPR